MALNYYKSLFQLRTKLLSERIEFKIRPQPKESGWEILIPENSCSVSQNLFSNTLTFTKDGVFTKKNLSVEEALDLIMKEEDTSCKKSTVVNTEGFKVFC